MSDYVAAGSPAGANSDWVIWLVGTSAEAGVAIRRSALGLGRSVFEVDVGTVRTTDELVADISRMFLVPREVRGLDALLSVLSDLDWLANENGYLFILDGMGDLRQTSEDLFNRLVRILPHLCDRWRSRSTPFQIILHADRTTASSVEYQVKTLYEGSRASRWRSDFTEVPVIDVDARHGDDA